MSDTEGLLLKCWGRCAVCDMTDIFHHEGRRSDVCECGDYRHQHLDDGPCTMRNDLAHGFRPCKAFRMSRPHHEFVALAPAE